VKGYVALNILVSSALQVLAAVVVLSPTSCNGEQVCPLARWAAARWDSMCAEHELCASYFAMLCRGMKEYVSLNILVSSAAAFKSFDKNKLSGSPRLLTRATCPVGAVTITNVPHSWFRGVHGKCNMLHIKLPGSHSCGYWVARLNMQELSMLEGVALVALWIQLCCGLWAAGVFRGAGAAGGVGAPAGIFPVNPRLCLHRNLTCVPSTLQVFDGELAQLE
jgi:hypothetical protein